MLAMAAILLASCSTTKYIPENHYLLKGVTVKSDNKDIDAATLQQYVRQRGNSKWFSLFKIPLGVFAMAGSDTTKWINRNFLSALIGINLILVLDSRGLQGRNETQCIP